MNKTKVISFTGLILGGINLVLDLIYLNNYHSAFGWLSVIILSMLYYLKR